MNKTLKRLLFFIGILLFVSAGVCFYIDLHQLVGKTSVEQIEVDAKLAELNHKIKGMQIAEAATKIMYDEKIKNMRDEQEQIKDQIKDIVKSTNDLRASTTTQNKDLSKLVRGLEDKDKEWIKESLKTMTSFEDDLAANKKDIDSLFKVELPNLNKEINDFRVERVYSRQSNGRSQDVAVVEKRVEMLEKQFKEIQEKTLSIILKTPH